MTSVSLQRVYHRPEQMTPGVKERFRKTGKIIAHVLVKLCKRFDHIQIRLWREA
jgi:hypothetical protein